MSFCDTRTTLVPSRSSQAGWSISRHCWLSGRNYSIQNSREYQSWLVHQLLNILYSEIWSWKTDKKWTRMRVNNKKYTYLIFAPSALISLSEQVIKKGNIKFSILMMKNCIVMNLINILHIRYQYHYLNNNQLSKKETSQIQC